MSTPPALYYVPASGRGVGARNFTWTAARRHLGAATGAAGERPDA